MAAAAGTVLRPADDRDAAPAPRRGVRLPWRTLLAAAGGLAMVLAFPGAGLVPLAVLGPAALALAEHGRNARGGL